VSGSAGGFDTTLTFDGRHVDLREATAFATLSWQKSPRWSYQLTAGGIFDGSVDPSGADQGDVGAGGALSVGASWLGVYEDERRPFLQLAGTFGFSTVTAISDDGERHRLTAGDLRLGALVGKTFFSRVTAYAAARVFGGPVFWRLGGESVVGGDTHHFAVGAGAILRLPGRVDVFAEGMALGERSVSLGAGVAF
jgi:hypothetical protein